MSSGTAPGTITDCVIVALEENECISDYPEFPPNRRAAETAAAAQRAHDEVATGLVQLAEFFHAATSHGGVRRKFTAEEMEQTLGFVACFLENKIAAQCKAEKAAAVAVATDAYYKSLKKLTDKSVGDHVVILSSLAGGDLKALSSA